MSAEPEVATPLPIRGGAPPCPACGYRCGCCCHHECQTLHQCPTPDADGDCDCRETCHGGHEPWDCWDFCTRYGWAKEKSARALEEAP